MIHLVIAGPPGSGKGTQALHIVEKFGLKHLSTGDLFRQHMAEQSTLGQQIQSFVDNGTLVPDTVTIQTLGHEINTPHPIGFLLDGFPRTIAQAQALDKLLEEKNAAVTGFLLLEVPEEELIDRIQKRSLLSGREDDKDLNKIRTRLNIYQNETLPLSTYYDTQNKCHRIHALGSIDEIFARICQAIEALLPPRS